MQSKFNIETYQLGFMQSATFVISIVVQSALVAPVMRILSFSQSYTSSSTPSTSTSLCRNGDDDCFTTLLCCLSTGRRSFCDESASLTHEWNSSSRSLFSSKASSRVITLCIFLIALTSLYEFFVDSFWVYASTILIPHMVASSLLGSVIRLSYKHLRLI